MCECTDLYAMKAKYEALMRSVKEYTTLARDMAKEAATLKAQINHEEAQRRLRLVK